MFPQLDPAAWRLIGIVLILVAISVLFLVYACCVVAGECSREEECGDGQFRRHE